jgi:hypothetical protein
MYLPRCRPTRRVGVVSAAHGRAHGDGDGLAPVECFNRILRHGGLGREARSCDDKAQEKRDDMREPLQLPISSCREAANASWVSDLAIYLRRECAQPDTASGERQEKSFMGRPPQLPKRPVGFTVRQLSPAVGAKF